jgi:hypothetical protein
MTTAMIASVGSSKSRVMNIPIEAARIGLARGIATRKARGAAHIAALGPRVKQLREVGLTMQEIADTFNDEGLTTPTGMHWAVTQVNYLLRKSG